jgi:hypothetical protein
MKALIKPFTEDIEGNKLMADIYSIIKDNGGTVTIEEVTVSGKHTYIINKDRVLKVLDDNV